MKGPENEKLLVARAKKGDGEAFGELVRFYEKFVYNTAYAFLFSADDAFDVSQDAFIKAWRGINNFKGDSAFSTWLYRIVVNTAKDAISRRGKRRELSSTDSEGEIIDAPAPDTPEAEYIKKESREELFQAIDTLDEDAREIIILRELDGLSYEEIATLLGLELGTVKSRLSRARAKLSEKLMEQNEKFFVK